MVFKAPSGRVIPSCKEYWTLPIPFANPLALECKGHIARFEESPDALYRLAASPNARASTEAATPVIEDGAAALFRRP